MARILWNICVLVGLLAACTPKATDPVSETKDTEQQEKTTEQEQRKTNCKVFSDADYPGEAREAHVLYRDFLKNGAYEEAFTYWKSAYAMAPAADGNRDYHFTDGVRLYKWKYDQAQSEALKDSLWLEIEKLYAKAAECYPEKAISYKGLKAFELFYNFPGQSENKEIYDLFASVVESEGRKTPVYVINPFTDILIKVVQDGQVDTSRARSLADSLKAALSYGLNNATGADLEAYKIVESYAPSRLKELETVKGFYDCDYYVENYYQLFEDNSQDCDQIRLVTSRLKWGGCNQERPEFKKLLTAYEENCRVSAGPLKQAYDCLNDADYGCAIEKFQKAANNTEDVEKKGRYTLLISKIYYSHLRDFPSARKYALQAAEIRPDWGEPLMLIGRLYASSGPLCGPGRGWDSQVVTWVAIDMWQKAKSVDPSVSSEANQFIAQYRQYMPTKEDVFQNPKINEGDSYFIPCWIQRSTRVRGR